MLLDQNGIFSEQQAISATAASTNVVDLKAGGNTARGALYFAAVVDAKFTGTTGTLTLSLQTANNSNFSDAVTLFSAPFDMSLLGVDGQLLCSVPMPQGLKRYVRVYYTVSDVSGGKISAFVTDGAESR